MIRTLDSQDSQDTTGKIQLTKSFHAIQVKITMNITLLVEPDGESESSEASTNITKKDNVIGG